MSLPLYPAVPAVSSVSILPVQCLYHCVPVSRLSALCQYCLYNVSTIVPRCPGCQLCVNLACTMYLPLCPGVLAVSSVSIVLVQCLYHCIPLSRLSVLCHSCMYNVSTIVSRLSVLRQSFLYNVSTVVSRLSVLCQSCLYNVSTIVSRCPGCQFCVNPACIMSLPLCPGCQFCVNPAYTMSLPLCPGVPAVSSVSILPAQCIYHCVPLSRLSVLCQSCLYNVSAIVSRCPGCQFCVNPACIMYLPLCPGVAAVSVSPEGVSRGALWLAWLWLGRQCCVSTRDALSQPGSLWLLGAIPAGWTGRAPKRLPGTDSTAGEEVQGQLARRIGEQQLW